MPLCTSGSHIIRELIDAGVIPQNCRWFDFSVEAGCAALIRCEVFATEEQVRAIAKAFERHPEEANAVGRRVIFKSTSSELATPEISVNE